MPGQLWMILGAILAAEPDPAPLLACLKSGDAQLSLEWEQRGCFHQTRGFVRVAVEGATARMQVKKDDAERRVALTATAARALMQNFAAAATRPEKFQSCVSTEQYVATLRWQCGGQAELEARFTTSACGHDYARARGLIELAQAAK